MPKQEGESWIDAANMASQALETAKLAAATQRAHFQVSMLMLATLAKVAPREAIDPLLVEFERIRDLSGPAGAAANEVFATAVSTLERIVGRG